MTRGASTNQQRVLVLLDQIGLAQEQMRAGKETIVEGFASEDFVRAAMSTDPGERNKVAAIEREFEVLVSSLHELAARSLDEGLRLGTLEAGDSSGWRRLAELGALPVTRADALSEAREMRNELGHHYPPRSWELLHQAVERFSAQVDPFLDEWRQWVASRGIFPF